MAIIHSFTGHFHVFYGSNSHRTVPGPTATPSRLGDIVLRRFRRWHHSPIPCRKCLWTGTFPWRCLWLGDFEPGPFSRPSRFSVANLSLPLSSAHPENCPSTAMEVSIQWSFINVEAMHSHGRAQVMIVSLSHGPWRLDDLGVPWQFLWVKWDLTFGRFEFFGKG